MPDDIESLLETVADITQAATYLRYRTDDSREAISRYVAWAREFEATRVEDEYGMALFYNGLEYLEAIDQFVQDKTGITVPIPAPDPPSPAAPTPRPPRPRRARPIPPDPDGHNNLRAGWAEAALNEFQALTNCDRDDVVADLLCNLRHWCDRNSVSFGRENERSARMYRDETTPMPGETVVPLPPPIAPNPLPTDPNDVPF